VRRPPRRFASLAADVDLAAAATALGPVTSAVIFPAEQVRPPSAVLFTPIATRSARLLAFGIDDAGPGRSTIKIAIVYRGPADARTDAAVFDDRLPGAALSDDPRTRFEDVLSGLHARVEAGRVVLISGAPRDPTRRGIWRELLERGDLAILIRRSLPG
jgi:hypothetical protein